MQSQQSVNTDKQVCSLREKQVKATISNRVGTVIVWEYIEFSKLVSQKEQVQFNYSQARK